MRIISNTETHTQGIKSKEKSFKISFIHLVVLGTVFFILYAFNECYSMKKIEFQAKLTQKVRIEQEIASLEGENRHLKSKITLLGTNEGVEEVAREKLGFIKPKEIAFVVISPPVTQTLSAPKVIDRKEKSGTLKQEIIKESSKKEGWIRKILNKLWRD